MGFASIWAMPERRRIVPNPGTAPNSATVSQPAEMVFIAASLCSTATECEGASRGDVTLDPLGSDSTVSGRIRLEFDHRPVLAGTFRAPWRPRQFLCG